ncbi:cysteine desulfurase family protein [Corynebacterium minutissimum]|uniref:Cysteine desulfurase n=1 Tax=Corynebacterium minutissimum TaxID=38301 RepID=A0A2X4RDY2_9CORY|nr:cysteine desulfurase family protein [Corynebacterium minutissimum]KHO29326.1 cysteine desulfurase [Corynebacterium minutissimum]QPS58746.1 cysteine desulfurase [Corynebacterium minutissimum]QQA80464.1 cysteine desulfurase [Corynebacterium minutissimum]SQI00139.1 cysteine desulfurase [Corynebacterium minutissimum]VEG05794.1 cysteine desulfurase [Corynebacterium minutissimum]
MPLYLDYAATQPMRQSAIDAWTRAASSLNPGASYASGRKARSVLDDARETVAELLGCEPIEVIFTSSGTEADNIAIQGLYRAAQTTSTTSGGAADETSTRIVSTPIEHPAVLETVEKLHAEHGATVELLPVDSTGHVSDLSALDTPAAVATCMWANNETGAVQPVADITERAAAQNTPVHIDAVQVAGKLPINFHELGATTLAASAHKFGGPRGIGLLLARRTPAPLPLAFGGGQERGIRPGTVDVASASALAAALRESVAEMEQEDTRLTALRDKLQAGIESSIDNVIINSAEPTLASHLHASFPGTDGDSLIMLLDAAGIEASAGSACHAGVNRMSHVLEAMGIDEEHGRGSLRFSLGRMTTEEDIDAVLAELPEIIRRARSV